MVVMVTFPHCRGLTSCMEDLGPVEGSCCSQQWPPNTTGSCPVQYHMLSEHPPESASTAPDRTVQDLGQERKGLLVSGATQAFLVRLWLLNRWEMAPGSSQYHHRQDSRGQVGLGDPNGCTQLAAHTPSSCLALRPLLTDASPLRQCLMPTLVLHPHPAREQTSTLPSLLPLQTAVGRRGQSSRSWRGQFPGPGKVPADGRWHNEGMNTPELAGTACCGVVPWTISQSPPHHTADG